MWVRRFALLLFVYVGLDFALPAMPGAVQLVDGCLDVVAGCQGRAMQTAVSAALPVSASRAALPARRDAARPARPAPVVEFLPPPLLRTIPEQGLADASPDRD